MEYLHGPITSHKECFYAHWLSKTESPYDAIKTISGGYVMFDVGDDYSIIPVKWYETLKLETKLILHYNDLEFLDSIDPDMLGNITHLGIVDLPKFGEYIDRFKSLKYLEISFEECNPETFINKLPIGLEGLAIIDYFNTITRLDNLPLTLKYLYIDSASITELNMLPPTIEILIFKNIDFNESIDNLPHGLKILLICSQKFNQSINNLPAGLEYFGLIRYSCHLQLKYTQPIMNLPTRLKYFILDHGNYYYYKDTILGINPDCNISYDNELTILKNIAKLFEYEPKIHW